MLKDDELTIGVFTCKHTGRASRVMFWRHYGVVCPDLWTTNGSAAMVARELLVMVNNGHGAWESKHPDIPTDLSSVSAADLKQKLISAFQAGGWG